MPICESSEQELRAALGAEHAELIDFHVIPLYPQVAEIFGADKSFSVLLRPDNHVGFITAGTSPDSIRAYLKEFVGYS